MVAGEIDVLAVEESDSLLLEPCILLERAAKGVVGGEATVPGHDAVAGSMRIFVGMQCPANSSCGVRLPAGRQVASTKSSGNITVGSDRACGDLANERVD